MIDSIRYELEGDVAVVGLDDGRANAVSSSVVRALHEVLDRAEKEANALLLIGRPERFSAGFDLDTMRAGPEAATALVQEGSELLQRIYAAPIPIVAGCTGHALAMGALLLLGCDWRVGTAGAYKIGLNEVTIQMTLPVFAVEIARERLSRRHFQRSVIQAEIHTPESAVDAGFLDRVVAADELGAAARADAERLAKLPRRAFAETKLRARSATLERMKGPV